LAGWLTWTLLALIVTARGYAHLQHTLHRLPRLRLPRPLQGLSALVLGSLAASSTPHTAIPPARPAAYVTATPHAATRPTPPTAAQPLTTKLTTARHGNHRQPAIPGWARTWPAGFYVIADGDTLWDIAQRQEGNPLLWHDWYALNRGLPQHNGHALHDPD